jgi:hypothetical protein
MEERIFTKYETIVARNIQANSESEIPVWTTDAERDRVIQEFKENPDLLRACLDQDNRSRGMQQGEQII